MAVDSRKYEHKYDSVLRDTRPMYARLAAWFRKRDNSFVVLFVAMVSLLTFDEVMMWGDVLMFTVVCYFLWLMTRDRQLPFKFPLGAGYADKNNGRNGKAGEI